jgi:hypothetical protein
VFNLPLELTPGFHRVDVYALDGSTSAATLLGSRTVNTNFVPLGSVDLATETVLAGWAYDVNSPSGTTSVLFQIDGFAPQVAAANVVREDLTASLGSAAHGYAIPLPRLTGGVHTVTVWAIDTTTFAPIGLGQRVIFSTSTTRGSIDLATPALVAGWAFDPERAAAGLPTQARIDIDGVAGEPFNATVARPDVGLGVGGAVGFIEFLPALSPGQHRVDVWAFDAPTGTPALLGSRLVTVMSPPPAIEGLLVPIGSLDAVTAASVSGWAVDPLRPGSTALVRLDIDDQPALVVKANAVRNDLAGVLGEAGHAFSVAMPKLARGVHLVSMSVINPLTFAVTPIVTKSVVV